MIEGDYGAGDAMRFSGIHPGPWAPELQEKIIACLHELHRQLDPPTAMK